MKLFNPLFSAGEKHDSKHSLIGVVLSLWCLFMSSMASLIAVTLKWMQEEPKLQLLQRSITARRFWSEEEEDLWFEMRGDLGLLELSRSTVEDMQSRESKCSLNRLVKNLSQAPEKVSFTQIVQKDWEEGRSGWVLFGVCYSVVAIMCVLEWCICWTILTFLLPSAIQSQISFQWNCLEVTAMTFRIVHIHSQTNSTTQVYRSKESDGISDRQGQKNEFTFEKKVPISYGFYSSQVQTVGIVGIFQFWQLRPRKL